MVPSGLIAVVRAADAGECRTIVRGLVAAGLAAVEVTMTVPDALGVIEELAAFVAASAAGTSIGAGTVLDPGTCRACIDAGATFIVSPITDLASLEVARSAGVGYVGGALTPSEVTASMRAGVDAVKIFPIGSVGGPAYLRALREPFPDLRAVVSGGVIPADVAAYWAAGAHAVCMGGALIDRHAARTGDVGAVERHAWQVVRAIEETPARSG
jgi:2-dehydro-3-deoxyphosphogluconate aldolase/(4S)-4-hydroxy-2-oxoglutarate aldolase